MSASYKQYLGLKYISDNLNPDFVYVCGGDAYLVIDNLQKLLDKFDPEDDVFIGELGDFRYVDGERVYFHSGGWIHRF